MLNVGRGAVVDETALIAALEAGKLTGAYLDVFATEPLPGTSPFWRLPNVIVSPHQSFVSDTNAARGKELWCSNLVRWCKGQALLNELRAEDVGVAAKTAKL